ncbi:MULTISPECIES: helix-turn-helix domain-containing protein [Brevundimonas]|uniref:helix-turn-helix domain-containing protein n=1 Tax=Brevundimonas TaxID=41275 RepID=UPI00174A043F|nr:MULTISPECIES: AraC family transcriptional regulator [Brevundimonas]
MTATAFKAATLFGLDRQGPSGPRQAPDRLAAHACVAVAAFCAYILARETQGGFSTAFAAFGVSACGWSWLLARALFDPAKHDALWPRLVVLVLAASGATAVLAPAHQPASTVANNLYVLSGSGALLMTFVEPFQRRGCALARDEVLFRAIFFGVFALLVGVAVLAAWTAPERVETACAVVGLAGAIGATVYRLKRPLVLVERATAARKPATADDLLLAERLERLLRDTALHLDPDLRIGDVAARLNAPEHRVSRCIGAATGFPNFNRLINHHRVEAAKRLLASSDQARSILQIALDCGFASLGPFNRAFREETGTTPRAYRALQRSTAVEG